MVCGLIGSSCRCQGEETAAGTSANSQLEPSRRPPASHKQPRRTRGCRALAVQGRVTAKGKPVAKRDLLSDAWVLLEKQAKLTLMHDARSVQWSIDGPATVFVCIDGKPDSALSSGKVLVLSNPPSGPTGPAMIATPFGTIQYAQTKLEIRSDGRSEAEVEVSSGTAHLMPSAGNRLAGEQRLRSGKAKLVAGERRNSERAMRDCEEAADSAAQLAKGLLEPILGDGSNRGPDGGTLGQRAAQQLRSRRRARFSCAVALSNLGLEQPAVKSELTARFSAARTLYRRVPRSDNAGKK